MAHILFDILTLFFFVSSIAFPSSLLALFFPYLSAFPFFVSLSLMIFIFLLSLIAYFALLSRLIPKPKAGKYPFPFHKESVLWGLHFSLQRVAMLPPWRNVFMSFNTLKFLFLKSLGAKIPFQIWTSSNIELAEIYMISLGKNALLGSRAEINCHFIRDNHLILAPTCIEEDAQILIDTVLGPACRIGKKSVLGPCSKMIYKVQIGESTHIGNRCFFETHIQIGDNVKIGDFVTVESAVTIESGVSIPSGTWIRKGSKINKDTKFAKTPWQTVERLQRSKGSLLTKEGLL